MEHPRTKEHKSQAPKSESSIQKFEFVTLTEGHKIDEIDRHTVRKQAMKNNTNRRLKSKHPSEQVVKSFNQLTGRPVVQQASQSKRFRLLPRGLQDLEDTLKAKPILGTSKRSRSRSSQSNHRNFELIPRTLSGDKSPWIWNTEKGSWDESSAIQYDLFYPSLAPSILDPIMGYLPDNAPYRTRLLIRHNCTIYPHLAIPIHSQLTCITVTAQSRATSLMISVRKSWFALSSTDLAFFNVVLAHYAGTYRLMTGQGDPMESFAFNAASIKIINERLDLPEQRTSDGTIAAVAGMVLKEIKDGNVSAVKVHLGGLEEMIKLRGGILNARFPASLQRMIAWADLNASHILSTQPNILPYTSPAPDIASYICTAGSSGPLLPDSPCPDRAITWEKIDTDISHIFIDLRYISSVLESDDPKDIEQIDNMWYSDKTYLVQRSLAYLYHNKEQVGETRLDGISCLAASIYIDSCLRDQRFSAGAIGILVARLRRELGSFLLEFENKNENEIGGQEETLLWICTFGAIAAYGWPERGWFVEHFASLCGSLNLTNWKQVEGILRGKLWNAKWEDPSGTLWQEVIGERII